MGHSFAFRPFLRSEGPSERIGSFIGTTWHLRDEGALGHDCVRKRKTVDDATVRHFQSSGRKQLPDPRICDVNLPSGIRNAATSFSSLGHKIDNSNFELGKKARAPRVDRGFVC